MKSSSWLLRTQTLRRNGYLTILCLLSLSAQALSFTASGGFGSQFLQRVSHQSASASLRTQSSLCESVASFQGRAACRRVREQPTMLFSIPDIGNLVAAPSGTRFFNPIWYPYFARPTHVVKLDLPKTGPMWGKKKENDIWLFEQPIGFLNITVNIRMTVIRLDDGSLLVKDPIAPTQQCIDALNELGQVKHIVLGTTALEHKYFCRAFADKFADASMYVPPGIFNYVPGRSDLQPAGLGLFVDLIRPMRIDGFLTPGFAEATLNGVTYPASPVPVWASELEHELLFFDAPPIASAAEAAFFHSKSKTLLVSDALTYIDSSQTDWITDLGLRDRSSPYNNYPQEWTPARKKALDQMQVWTVQTPYKDEDLASLTNKLYVCPQLRLFVFESDPALVGDWVRRITKWDTQRLVASHFDAPVACSKQDILAAFSFILRRDQAATSAPLPGDYCLGVQKAVQVILRRTLFKNRLADGRMQEIEYAGDYGDGQGYVGKVELPLVGETRV